MSGPWPMSPTVEYSVRWKWQGRSPRRRLYATKAGADRFAKSIPVQRSTYDDHDEPTGVLLRQWVVVEVRKVGPWKEAAS